MTNNTDKFSKPDHMPDWSDTVYGPLRIEGKTSRELFMMALENPPKWFEIAMKVRNLIVAPLGLKTEIQGSGPLLARLPVIEDTEQVFEAGIDDKHLTFTLQLKQHGGIAFLTTNIWFNSVLGRIYLAIITPGHILAVKQLARSIADPIRRTIGGYEKAKLT